MALNSITRELLVCGDTSIALFKLDYVGYDAPLSCPHFPMFPLKSQGATLTKRKGTRGMKF